MTQTDAATVRKQIVVDTPIEDARTRGDRRREDSVEVLPPPRISHTPETYQRAARERGCPGFHATTCSVSVSDRDSTSITFLSGTRSTQCLDLAPLVREY